MAFANLLWTLSGIAIIRVGGEYFSSDRREGLAGEIRWMGNSGEGISTPVIDWTSRGSCDLLKGTVFFVNRRGGIEVKTRQCLFFFLSLLFWPKSFKVLKWHRRGTWLRATRDGNLKKWQVSLSGVQLLERSSWKWYPLGFCAVYPFVLVFTTVTKIGKEVIHGGFPILLFVDFDDKASL